MKLNAGKIPRLFNNADVDIQVILDAYIRTNDVKKAKETLAELADSQGHIIGNLALTYCQSDSNDTYLRRLLKYLNEEELLWCFFNVLGKS